MAKVYYCEDRSAGNTGKEASPQVCNIIQLFELTDWSVSDMDKITDLGVAEELTTQDKVFVRRLT